MIGTLIAGLLRLLRELETPEHARRRRKPSLTWFERLYPDLRRAGGLRTVLQGMLRTVVLEPVVDRPGWPRDSGFGAGARTPERSIGVALAVQERLFTGQIWDAGVCLGGYGSTSLPEVAELFEQWLVAGRQATRLSVGDATTVELHPKARFHEEGPGAYVEYSWRECLRFPFDDRVPAAVAAAMKVPVLRGLLPYTSHSDLHFSRCTGFPFSYDCPYITPLENGLFAVMDASRSLLGTGDADAAAALAAANLPPFTGPARRGAWTSMAPYNPVPGPGTLRLAEYDPAWTERFAEEEARIRPALGTRAIAIEHVGSTAVPGLAGKPVLDLGIAVASEADADACIAPLQALGYTYRGAYGDDPRRRYYVRDVESTRMAQIHLYILPARAWDEKLAFRDALRADPALAREYERVKWFVADAVGWDKAAYSLAKGPFVERVLAALRANPRS